MASPPLSSIFTITPLPSGFSQSSIRTQQNSSILPSIKAKVKEEMAHFNTLIHFISLVLLSTTLLLLPTHAKIPNKTKPITTRTTTTTTTYIIQTKNLTRPTQFTSQTQWYTSIVQSILPTNSNLDTAAVAAGRIFYTYETVMHGFAATLTPQEANKVSAIAGVIGIYEDRIMQTHTTRSPNFLGLNAGFGLWPESNFGQDVVIGLVDTGIWPESKSFDDAGLPPVRDTWRGQCVEGTRFNASSCNNKLVGARYFADGLLRYGIPINDGVDEFLSPRDKSGHGTHTSSTAAGAAVPNANFFGAANGTARGIAPRARLAMYKACWNFYGCFFSDVLAAIDNAVLDGVDVLSLSLGGSAQEQYDSDPIAVATFAAVRAGIFVTCSAGNSGPYEEYIVNAAPWITTIGAGSIDRRFEARVVLGNGKVLLGESLYHQHVNKSGMTGIVYVGSCDGYRLAPAIVKGKIVICDDAFVGTGSAVKEAGGAGMIAVNVADYGEGIIAEAFILPAVTVGHAAEKDIREYLNSTGDKPVARLEFGTVSTVVGENRAPAVAGFSSRGPNPASPEILKPDVIAPGMNILAAWPDESPVSGGDEGDHRRSQFNIISGTSMSSPHVAGVAAALRGAHPTWTPAMIRSAIMTTAATLDNNYRPIIAEESSEPATPFAIGAGLIYPPMARDPGLVYDAGVQDYIDFLCALNYTAEQLQKIVGGPTPCTEIDGGGLNYPSFVVVFEKGITSKVLKRTLTKVYELPEIYNARVVNPRPEKVEVRVKPEILEFEGVNEERSYEVEFRSKVVMEEGDKFEEYGFIIWENKEHQVKSPVVFMWK